MSAESEVAEVLERFCRGWENDDADAVLSCFAESDETVVIGTDAGEYWRGYARLIEPFRAMAAAFEGAQYTWVDGPVIHLEGERAWADGVLRTAVTAAGEVVEAHLRTTWLLQRGAAGWRVTQAHFSVAPDAPVVAY